MNYALALNVIILAIVALGLILTGNPLFFLGVLALQEMPYALLQSQMQLDAMSDQDDDEPQPMGFTQELKKR